MNRTITHKKVKSEKTNTQHKYFSYNVGSICISTVIFLLFAYILFDSIYLNYRIDSKIVLIDRSLDSLKTYSSIKMHEIDDAFNLHKEQSKIFKIQ
jgi:hypothetical protein